MISTKDILTGFLRNYCSLKIDIEGTLTSWTFKSMDYFNQLGKLLGYWVELEGHRYDLIWYTFNPRSKFYEGDNIFLRLEHENSDSMINETIEKLTEVSSNPVAMKRIGIVYPEKTSFDKEVSNFANRFVDLNKKNEEIALLFFGFMKPRRNDEYWHAEIVRKYNTKQGTKTKHYKFIMKKNENEIIYTVFKN